jgi:hypothetical protein
MSLGYVLFSQTSDADGTRDRWQTGTLQNNYLLNTDWGIVNGAETTVAGSTWTNPIGTNNDKAAAYSLAAVDALFDSNGLTANKVLGASANTGIAIADIFADNNGGSFQNGLAGSTYGIGLAESQWNKIKNLEIWLTSADLISNAGLTGDGDPSTLDVMRVVVQNIVDTRVKVGTEKCADLSTVSYGSLAEYTDKDPKLQVDIGNAKRGEFDATFNNRGVLLNLDVWTNNSGWQNSFDLKGSAFNDHFEIEGGSKTAGEFGTGAGTATTGIYDGRLTTIYGNLGFGNDSYDATGGRSEGADTVAEWQLIDKVSGGSGNDTITTGGGNDVIDGDGADAAVRRFSLGGSNSQADWRGGALVNEIVQIRATSLTGQTYDADTQWSNFASPNNYGVAGMTGIGVWSGSGQNNGGNNNNPEINGDSDANRSDTLSFDFRNENGSVVNDVRAFEAKLGLFYYDDTGAATSSAEIETGRATLYDDGIAVAELIFRADNTVTFVSGDADFDASIVTLNANADSWDADTANDVAKWDGSNKGESLLSMSATGGASFDRIDFSSAGAVSYNGGSYTPNNSLIADYLIREICFTLSGEDGNDVINGGAGNDTIEGSGDTGTVEITTTTEAVSILPELRQKVIDNGGDATVLLRFGAGATGWNQVAHGAMDADNDGDFDGWVMSVLSGATGTFDITEYNVGTIVNDFAISAGERVYVFVPTATSFDDATLGAPASPSVTYIATFDADPAGGATLINTKSSGSAVFNWTTQQTVTTATITPGDDLTGGDGADKFIFRDGDGVDVIRDFTPADQLLLQDNGEAITQTVLASSNLGAGLLIEHGTDGDALFLAGLTAALTRTADAALDTYMLV